MIVPGSGLRVVVATKPVDFRKQHDGLAAIVANELGLDPYSGIAVVFRPKRLDRIKVLWWDGTGLVMAHILEAIAAGHPASRIDELLPWNPPSLSS